MKKIFLALALFTVALMPFFAQAATVAELQAMMAQLQQYLNGTATSTTNLSVAELQAMIEQLQKQLATMTGIIVTSPSGGETLSIGQSKDITWTTQDANAAIGNVQIGLIDTRYGTEVGPRGEQIIAYSIPNTGKYSWTVPRSLGNMSLTDTNLPVYKIIVHSWNSSPTSAAINGTSDTFSIVSQDDSVLIAQLLALIAQLQAQIDALLRGGATSGLSISSVSGPASLEVGQNGTWTINASVPAGSVPTYMVNWGDVAAMTNSTFGGTSVGQNATFRHSFSQAGTYTVRFKVVLPAPTCSSLAPACTNVEQSAESTMTVAVGQAGNKITVLSPNGHENFISGATIPVKFETNLPYGTMFEVSLVGKAYDQTVGSVKLLTKDKVSLDVVFPSNVSGYYRIRVDSSTPAGIVQDQSDFDFYVAGSIAGTTTPATGQPRIGLVSKESILNSADGGGDTGIFKIRLRVQAVGGEIYVPIDNPLNVTTISSRGSLDGLSISSNVDEMDISGDVIEKGNTWWLEDGEAMDLTYIQSVTNNSLSAQVSVKSDSLLWGTSSNVLNKEAPISVQTASLYLQGKNLTATNGACGSANGTVVVSAPSSNLCSMGNASAVDKNGEKYLWNCSGTNGGTTASCSADQAAPLVYSAPEINYFAGQASHRIFLTFPGKGALKDVSLLPGYSNCFSLNTRVSDIATYCSTADYMGGDKCGVYFQKNPYGTGRCVVRFTYAQEDGSPFSRYFESDGTIHVERINEISAPISKTEQINQISKSLLWISNILSGMK